MKTTPRILVAAASAALAVGVAAGPAVAAASGTDLHAKPVSAKPVNAKQGVVTLENDTTSSVRMYLTITLPDGSVRHEKSRQAGPGDTVRLGYPTGDTHIRADVFAGSHDEDPVGYTDWKGSVTGECLYTFEIPPGILSLGGDECAQGS